MKKKLGLWGILLVLFFAAAAASAGAASEAGRKAPVYKEGELLVKLRPGAAARAHLDREVISLRAFRVPASARGRGIERWRVAKLRKNADLAKVRGRLLKNPNVESVEYNARVKANLLTNDPSLSELWGLDNQGLTGGTADADIDAPEAWDLSQGTLASVVVGVLDTGVDYLHEDLDANIWTNPGEIADNGIDDDNNGYVDDVHGYDFVNMDGDPTDDNGHGTHVSGTIAAEANNAIGVVGVSRNAKIMAVKFLDANGYGYTDGAISALLYATSMGAKLTNNSWDGGTFSQAMYDAITAADAAGALFVAAAGNNYQSNNDFFPSYPSSYDVENVIAVAASNSSDGLAAFSNIGPTTVDLAAPGEGILSTLLGDTYGTYSGTSMAAAYVSGVLAVMKGAFPTASHMTLKTRLFEAVDPLQSLSGLVATGGRLNFANALQPDTIPPATVSDLEVAGTAPSEVLLGWTGVGVTEQWVPRRSMSSTTPLE